MRFFFYIAILCIPLSLFAQKAKKDMAPSQIWEAGLPFITNYTPEDYKAHVQNWSFVQDSKGIIYVGNTSGILEFDGVSWRLLTLPNGSPAKSFAKSEDDIIYVGAVRDFGYLQPDSIGQMQFKSLLSKLDSPYHNFADIWFTYAIKDAAYFISDNYIFKWCKNKFKVWKAEKGFGFAGQVRNQIYIDKKGIGLMKLENDSLMLIPDGNKFLDGKSSVTTFLPYGKNKILMGHFYKGLFLYDHQKIAPFKKEGKNLLEDKFIYDGQVLQNGNFVFGTHGKGCFIVDKNGNVVQWLSKKRGLNSNVIIGSYSDAEGSLWLATESGISRVEISSPIRVFGAQSGLSEGADRIVCFKDKLYAAAKNGLFFLKNLSFDPEMKEFTFQKINGIDYQTWDIATKSNNLLAGNFNGLYQIDPVHNVKRLAQDNTSILCPSRIDKNRVYTGTMTGKIYVLKYANKEWKIENSNATLEGRIIKMEENSDGSIWVSTRYNGVYKLDWSKSNVNKTFDKDYSLKHFTTDEGLPEISYNIVYQINNKTFFSTREGIYRFDSKNQIFKPDPKFTKHKKLFSGFEHVLKESSNGGMWVVGGSEFNNRIYRFSQEDLVEVDATKRFIDYNISDIYEINDLVFFSGVQGSMCYSRQVDKDYRTPFRVCIRKVLTNNDSLIFGGNTNKNQSKEILSLPFENNYLRFVFALPNYDKPESNQYQYYLEGFDKTWSGWTAETQKDYTNLPEGDYKFSIKGRNIYGKVSNEAVYTFTILPPWYRTWWAYLIYGLGGIGFITLIVKWRSRQLKKEKRVLENIVAERTHQLAGQAEKLKEMDQQKSRFFANISHEFRTPLTLIKGPAENALQSNSASLTKKDTLMIRDNANRLLRLVNQLLDLSKLDANKLTLSPKDGNISQFLRAIGSAFSSHARQRNVDYRIDVPEKDICVSFDHDKLEKILYNLLSNAFKFCADKGKVVFSADIEQNDLIMEVSDNGIGIPQKQLPFIFDRFYQTDGSHTREYEGAGIGLALSRELITLMHGNIDVMSDLDHGTTFTVTIPVKRISEAALTENAEKKKDLPSIEIQKRQLSEGSSNGGKVQPNVPIILIVEDNADMREFIKKQLADEYNILEAANGKTGLEIARADVPDLVITDLMMPQMDGMEFCRLLKTDERTSHIPVIMLTAKAGQEQKIEGLETGADGYLTKPFDKKELKVRVKNLITQRQQLRERFSREILLEPKKIAIAPMDEQFLQKILDRIEMNLSDPEFGVPQLQDDLAMSKTQLYRKMKALTDRSPGEFIRNYRLKRAAQILAQQGDNVTQVAYSVGFNNLSYFAKCFKELFGVNPSEYSDSLSSKKH